MSKRITPCNSAAKKRAAFTKQKQKFNAPHKVPKYVEVGFGVGAEETYLRKEMCFWKQWSKNYYG